MKRQSLLFLIFLFAMGVKAQNCNFNYSFAPGAMNVVSFTPSSSFSPNIFHFEWDFGDGHTSTAVSPTHPFNSLPPYVVCYNVLDSVNNIICSACDTITTSSHVSCSFTSTQGSGLDVEFYTPPSVGYLVSWSFDQGVSWVSGNPYTHVFGNTGTYNVCLLKIDSLTRDTICNSTCNTITVSGPSNTCDFSVSTTPGNGFNFQFTSNAPLFSNIYWDFGDGAQGTGRQVSHLYTTADTFNVCMTVVDTLNDTCHYCHPVVAGNSHGNCSFSVINDTIPNSFLFIGNHAYPNSTLTWDFGDNTAGSGTTVGHTYSNPGTYTVCMTESDSNGTILCTMCINVSTGSNNCSFSSTPNPFHSLTLDFQANSGFFSTVTWDFGDGSASGTGAAVTHTYAAAGTYNVCITVATQGAVTCTYCELVTVTSNNTTCSASFLATTLGLTAYFIDMSVPPANATTYSWDFGDNTTSSSRFPQHTYNHAGTYNVCLDIFANGCTDRYCSTVTVDSTVINPISCQALFAIVQLSPFQVTVVNLSSGVNLSFLWDFGDGSSDTQPFPSHLYANTGVYNLCLTVSDANGCTSTYCDTLAVDSLGNIFRSMTGFTVNVVSPSQLTGVNELSLDNNFSIFPNPVNSELYVNVKSGGNKVSGYRILSLLGSEILRGNLNGLEGTINMNDLTSGTYLLEITSSDGSRGYQSIIKN